MRTMECGVESPAHKMSSTDKQQNSLVSTTITTNPSSTQVIIKQQQQHQRLGAASTNSSEDGTAHSSVREEEVSLDNNSVTKNHPTSERMDKIQIRKKVPKHLLTESSSSNSSSATAVSSRSEKKKKNSPKKELLEEKDNNNNNNNKASWLNNSVDSMPLKGSGDQVYEGGGVNNKKSSFNGYGSRDECSDMSTRKQQQQFTAMKGAEEKSQESFLRQTPNEVVPTISSKSVAVVAESTQDTLGFDLNVDLEVNEGEENPWHHNSLTAAATHVVNGSEPVTVMAKIAVPNGLPSAPLQFDGKLAWRSSPTTSAFRPTTRALSNHSDRKSFDDISTNNTTDHGFDLNIVAADDSPPIEFESSTITTDFRSVETKSPTKVSHQLSLDLNCGDDEKRNCHQSYLKLQMGRGFDLNENLSLISTDSCTDVYNQSAVKYDNRQLRHHSLLSSGSTITSSRERLVPTPPPAPEHFHMGGLSSRAPPYWVDMGSTIPSFGQQLQGQSFVLDSGAANYFPVPSDSSLPRQIGVARLQSKVAFPPGGPPQSGFYVTTPNNALPSYYPCPPNMFAPWTGQPRLTNFVPQIASGGQLHPTTYQATGPPNIHVFESSQGLYPNNIAGGQMGMMRQAAGCYPYSGTGMVSLPPDKEICNNGNVNERVFMGSGNQVPHVGERTTTQLLPQYMGASPPPQSVKRREPGGGWDTFQQQLNCRRMTAWK